MHSISDESISAIVSLLNAYDLANLWLTGDKRLRQLLSKHKIVSKFDLNYDGIHKLKWPTLLSVFPSLTVVRIRCSSCHIHYVPDVNLASIPPSVTQVNLAFANDWRWMLP